MRHLTITRARCFRYQLPLDPPLPSEDGPLSEREGLLLRLTDEAGITGWGEAAPLPGFSRESAGEAGAALARAAEALEGQSYADPGAHARPNPDRWAELPPSVQFAVESALLELHAAAQGRTFPALVGTEGDQVRLNALISADAPDVRRAAERCWEDGYRTLKLKVGRRAVGDDVRRVHAVADVVGEGGRIRLDANRAWSVGDAVQFAEALGPVPLEYVEEPLADPSALPDFAGRTGLPVALDETTREQPPEALDELAPIAGVVLKPTLLGGVTTVRHWAAAARAQDAALVLTGAYESGVGIRMIAALAAALTDAAAGLLTYDRLAEDVLTPRLAMGPTVRVADAYDSLVEEARLIPVDDPDE
jgi:O-succinylbenzoate synthase